MQKPHAQSTDVPANLAFLRAQTAAAHARTESLGPLLKLMSPELDLLDYGRALSGLYLFQSALQAALLPRLMRLGSPLAPNAATLASLRADLNWLGLGVPRGARPRVALGRGASAYGALYVLEGSSLGGRVIGRHISSTLGLGPGHGAEFFCGVSAQAARARWAQLADTLAALPQSTQPQLLHGALAAFGFLESVFTVERKPGLQRQMPSGVLPSLNSF